MIAADKRSNVIRKLDEIVINRIAAGEGNHGCIFSPWCNGIVNDD